MSVFISDIDKAKLNVWAVATEMTSNFYKCNTALYKIFIHGLLAQFAVSFKCWFKWIRLLVVAYESLKTKEKSSWVIPKVVAVANGSFSLQNWSYTTSNRVQFNSSNRVSQSWS